MDEAAGGEVIVSEAVRSRVPEGKFTFRDRGDVQLKGFDEPTHLYEVRWQEETDYDPSFDA